MDLLRQIPGEVFRLLSLVLVVALGFVGWFAWQIGQQNEQVLVHNQDLELAYKQQLIDGRPAAKPAPVLVTPLTVRAEAEQAATRFRGLIFREPVAYRWIERADLRAAIAKRLETAVPAGTWPEWQRALVALGAVPTGTDVRAVCLAVGVPDPAATYFNDEHRLYTASDFLPERLVDRLQLVLSLVYALQDQNLMVTGSLARAQLNHDRYWAWQALREGDAQLTLSEAPSTTASATELVNALKDWQRGRLARLEGAPPFLQRWLTFPEQWGPQFVATLRDRGGAEPVRQAFLEPPSSSEQILHPEKYKVAHDEPTPVGLAPLELPGWQPAGSDVLGEYGVRTLLESRLDQVTARLAAQGWDGDRYIVYTHGQDGATALIWRTIWDSEQDAFEFEDAFRSFAQARWRKEPIILVRGVYVTILQSEDDVFLAAAQKVWGGGK